MDKVSVDYKKAQLLREAFNKYSEKMRLLRDKKFDTVVEYRKKIDAVKLSQLWAEFERRYKDV